MRGKRGSSGLRQRKNDYTFNDVTHACGHISAEVKVQTTNCSAEMVREWKEKELCEACKGIQNAQAARREEVAQTAAKEYIRQHGIESADISTYNDGGAVEIIIRFNIAQEAK